ncbi:MAG: metallophosphoesterase [candidate division Zixibacteria bacterium]|nr:metallophosphoesterase [candidate division Zixibacteria bacterium]
MRNNKSRLIVAISIILIAFAFSLDIVNAGSTRTQAEIAADSLKPAAGKINDGPYVYWRSPSSITVFYNCGGEMLKRDYSGNDTIRFNGLCDDSSVVYVIPTKAPVIEPHVYTDVRRIFTISDIHGEYDELIEILINSQVIDSDLRWLWGDGHLVIDGDTFDRGDQVNECLWLLYRLEQEARFGGGRVHFLIGNHEAMPLYGDIRYVNEKYTDGIVKKSRIRYEDLYGPDMELGRWLRTKHTIVKINDILFVHAGISPEVIKRNLTINEINELIRDNLGARSYMRVFNDDLKLLFKSYGPLWYRGLVEEGSYPRATREQVDKILAYFDSEAIVVGHTGVDQVISFYDNRVFAIDVPVEDLGTLQALLWDDGVFYRVTGAGVLEEPR